MMPKPRQTLSWFGIFRIGLVQAALGAIVVLTTSTLNRIMVVELALPAMLPGLLVGLHYAMQVFRPRLGYGSDLGGRRTPWILGGMAVLAAGGMLAAVATALMETQLFAGIVLAIVAFILIGIGVGAAGTSLLVLLAKRTHPSRRSAAASIAWIMMIAGFIVTTIAAGHALDPYSGARLVTVSSSVSVVAMVLATVGIWNIEGDTSPPELQRATRGASFAQGFMEVWAEPKARRFAIFIFVSMLAYSAQDLILEPFAGAVFGMTPGETTKLSGVQHSGALIGMILVPVINALVPSWQTRTTPWVIGGCIASALAVQTRAGSSDRARMATARVRMGAGRHQRRLRDRRDRRDDESGRCRTSRPRRHADGTMGRRAGHLVRHRRISGDASHRWRTAVAVVAFPLLFARLCNRSSFVRAGRLPCDLDRPAVERERSEQAAGLARQSGSMT